MTSDYSVWLISNEPKAHAVLQACLPNEVVHFFDGTNYPSFSKLVNDCVAAAQTETVVLMSDKVRPTQADLSKVLSLLDTGFALAGLYAFGFFGIRKQLFREIGGFDTRYPGGYEDDDIVLRLIQNNLACYLTEEVAYVPGPSRWAINGWYPGVSHFEKKWRKVTEGTQVLSMEKLLPELPFEHDLGPSKPTKWLPAREHSYVQSWLSKYFYLREIKDCFPEILAPSSFDGQHILITGGTGSWGYALVDTILSNHNPKQITIVSRGELAQVTMKRQFSDPKVKLVLGDVRDLSALINCMQNVDVVFHLAALKHVPVCENNPTEVIKTNITGVENVIDAAIANGVERVIYVSSDKACEPVNLYGMSKAVGEKLIIQANNRGSNTKFVCIRGGNVLGSSGSVVPLFLGKMRNNEPIQITHPDMTRFFLTQTEAISLLLRAASASQGGETFVMKMPACSIVQLSRVLMAHSNTVPIDYTGIREGEKLHEILLGRNETPRTRVFDDNYFVILPPSPSEELQQAYSHCPAVDFDEFSSSAPLMSDEELVTLLKRGKWL